MLYNNEREAADWIVEQVKAYEPMRYYAGRQIGINRCMFTGKQWVTEDMLFSTFNELGRHLTNYNPDTNKLRIVLNRINRFIHEVAAATFPDEIEYDVSPSERDVGPEAAMTASVLNDVLDVAIDQMRFTEAARACNYKRCIDGLFGIGLAVKREQREVARKMEDDFAVSVFPFDFHRLILDPASQDLDLWLHDFVIYRDVWTINKIRRELGVTLDPDQLKTVGQLMPLEMAMNRLSQNRLYTYLREFSQTKGAFVYQVHVRDENKRFPTMLIGYDSGENNPTWVNFDNQESPFGGNGLPFMLLHAYREPDVMISQSDVALLKPDQDRINLLSTMFFRVLQKYSGFQWLVQKETMPGDGVDDYKSMFNNYVGGVIEYKGSPSRDRVYNPPQLVNYPTPQPFLQEAIGMYQERDMPAQIHRPPITVGETKSHVPNRTFQDALQQAGQVLGNRQREDTYRYEEFGKVILGTYVNLAQKGYPSVLVQLRRAGFDAADFAILEQVDPHYPACDVRLAENSIRFRSTEQKEESLNTAAQLQMISQEEYRMAKADLDAPLTEEDRLFDTAAKKEAVEVLLGAPWVPRSLGKATPFFLSAFQRAMFDRRAKLDPSAMQRLNDAVSMMMATANAEMQQRVLAENPQPAQPQQQSQPQQEMPSEVNIADLITSLNSGGGSAMSGAQPAAA